MGSMTSSILWETFGVFFAEVRARNNEIKLLESSATYENAKIGALIITTK